ncbi:uncharacterized protein LOC125521570 [Triticum urartu]|uniref:uncharacterized protein LOC125521570 n=1 Tax=Triticum urartu TaxID=4572 RepID=UPI00204327E5|nr:uncharacterized protein LOC125521570 [Triticum urartu]
MRDAPSSWPAAARAATRARGKAVAQFVQTRHRSSGKVLGEEETAAENVYIKSSAVLGGVAPPVHSSGCSEPCCQSSSSTGPSTPTRWVHLQPILQRCYRTQGWSLRLLAEASRSSGLVLVISARIDGLASSYVYGSGAAVLLHL